ncbi:DUF5787 family protein [Halobaculum sp. MBLA0147]|uniref:DUF5787 family protein n=1 Tax=Halobaculum sp. MBLA0147 TaxID=3079934 RepID=UPI0035238785
MEYGFELALCAHLERDPSREWVLGRQLGAAVADPGRRVIDVVGLAPGPAFDDRAEIGTDAIPPAVIESDLGVGRARRPEAVLDTHPDRRDDVVDAAVDAGFLEREWRDGTELVRQPTRYPDDWFDTLVGVENKPDLDRPGDLADQLRRDASLGLFDRVVLATASHVTRAHLNRIPDPVGVWRFDPEAGTREVVRDPEPLSPADAGLEVGERRAAATDVRVVSAAAKRRRRRRIAERVYGGGWRPTTYPACARCVPDDDGLPYCEAFERVVDPGHDCGADCPRHDPADPPAVDVARLRAERTPWVRDPDGVARRQAGLDRFG